MVSTVRLTGLRAAGSVARMALPPGRFLLPPGTNVDKARLYHALREAGLQPLLRANEHGPMLGLGGVTKLESGVGPVLQGISVEHSVPRVRVGRIEQPYIFPHALVDLCLSTWALQRDLRVSFRGLMTPRRAQLLYPWRGRPGVSLLGTERGRASGTKYWDTEYFAELGRSEYVLSPDGDFPFAYRTFEAALCGAVPIVETRHPCYGDLHVLALGEVTPETLPEWSAELAAENLARAEALTTVPREALRAEVYRLGGWHGA